jgi:riboflavin kinase/FMN adenylyltransferase
MKLIRGIDQFEAIHPRDTAVTVGVFDGVHIGHQDVIRRLLDAKHRGGNSASILLTFDRHPLSVTHPEAMPPLLTTLDEKLSLLEPMGIDYIVVAAFSRKTASIDYRTFIGETLIGRLGMQHLVVGYDFHLGSGREGSQQRLKEAGEDHGFAVSIVPPVVLVGRVVSSTKIRRALSERKLGIASRLLGRKYFFDADVERGEGLGSRIGFPTANLRAPDPHKLLPPSGVYAVRVERGGDCIGGMMNIGSAPTIHRGGGIRIEVHLFGFEGDLYGESLRVHCIGTIRNEKRFAGIDGLKAQLMLDREKAFRILEKKD